MGVVQGIGWVIVELYLCEGVVVWVMDFNLDGVVIIDGVIVWKLDVINVDVVNEMFLEVSQIDVLVNCVGVVYVGFIFEVIYVDFDFVFNLNVKVMFDIICVVLLGMIVWENGLIINIVLVVFLVIGVFNCFVYGIIKVVVIGLIKVVVVDYVIQGVCCNVICFGIVDSLFLYECLCVIGDYEQVWKDFNVW